MRIYLAAPWLRRHEVPAVAAQLEAAGHTITERWWEHPDVNSGGPDAHPELERQAFADFEGVVRADALVLLNLATSEGKAVETGVALALVKPVVVVGERSNVFHHMPNVHLVGSVEAALSLLS